MRANTILNQVRISFAILAAAAVMVFFPYAGIKAKAADTAIPYTITYEAGENGRFSNGSSENKVTYALTHHDTSITKYSHTANIDDTGAANGQYASNLNTTDTVTIPGATKLTIDVWYSTESTSYDWLAIYPAGVVPSSSNDAQASISNGKLGGGSSYSKSNATHKQFIVNGDTAQFYFKSDGSANYYGYYATITADSYDSYDATSGTYEEPVPSNSQNSFFGWYTDTSYSSKIEDPITLKTNSTVYAKIARYTDTGTWGTCPWGITKDGVLEIGAGTGAEQIGYTSPWGAYHDKITAIKAIGTVKAPANCRYLFSELSRVSSTDLKNFDAGSVTNMYAMFDGCKGLTSLDVSNWNTGNVTNMSFMFSGCSGLTSLDVSNWNTDNVKDMREMFYGCKALTSLDVSKWDTGSVTNMGGMFRGCNGLTSLDVNSWDTGKVTDMSYMFDGCRGLTSLDVSNLNTGSVKDMSGMFNGCSGLTSLDVSNWNTGKVTSTNQMFRNCSSLTSLDVSNWDTGSVKDMSGMFSGRCKALTSLDVTNMSAMFEECSNLTTLDVSGWNTGSVTDMSHMFEGCSGLTSLDVSNWNTGSVTNVGDMFYHCSGLTSLDVSNWNTDSVTSTYYMFNGCDSLNTVSFGTKWTKPLSGAAFPSTTDWRKKRDADGTKLTGAEEYTLAKAKAASDTDPTVVVPQTVNSTKTATLAGTWKRAAFDYYEDLGDGDIRYDSRDVIASAGDTDTGNKWVKSGDKWIYKFKVFDDSRTYYLTEDDMDGYTKQFASTGTSAYGVINKTGSIDKSDTVTNTSINETVLIIEKQITAQDGSAVTDEDNSKMFPFTITLKDGNGNALSGTLVFGNTVFKDGVAHVSASVNVPMSITGIPAGYSYTVTEEDTAGYEEPAPKSGTIDAKNSNVLTFTNIKEKVKPASEENYCTLTVAKKVTGRFGDAVPTDKYSFTVDFSGLKKNSTYYKGDNTTFTATESGTASVECTLGDGESAVFYVPAETKYVVTEKAGSYAASDAVTGSSDITRDSGKNTEENKPLSTEEETLSDGENNTVLFTNDIEVKQNLTIRKFTGTGDETKTDTFDFTADQKDRIPDEKFNFQIAFYNLQEGDSFTSDIGRIKAQEPADADDIAAGAAENTYTAKKDFTLKGGESISFSGIPVGVKYIVTEKETPCTVQCVVEGTDVATGKEDGATASKGTVVTPYTVKTHPTAMETVDPDENGIVTFNNRRSSTAALQIIKKGSGSERLEGAVFVVCDESGTPLTYADGNTMILTSESSGYTNIVNGLAAGTYLIKETKVPDGYTAMAPYTLTITDKDFGTLITLTFKDDKLVELPSTGGPGTVLYTVLFTIAAAAFLGIVLRQKAGRQT